MNILFHLHGFPPTHGAGAELTAFAIATFLVKQGHIVDVICPTFGAADTGLKQTFDYQGVKVHWDLPKEDWVKLYADCHCVITHLDATRTVIREARAINKPVVHLIHNGQQLMHHKVLPHEAQLVVYNSFHLADTVRYPAPSVVCFPPVHLPDYQIDWNKPRKCYSLINLNDNKGGGLFWTLAEEFPERRFLGQKGSYGEQLVRNNQPSNVTILENHPDVKRVYQNTHVLLMPSKSETWGRVAVEAASNGIPIIANPTVGLKEALGEDGAIWVGWKDTQGWIEAIRSLDDKNTYLKYSRNAYYRAKELEQLSLIQLTGLEQALYSISHTSRKRVFALTSEPQYTDHLAPILHALQPNNIGFVVVADNGSTKFATALRNAYEHDLVVYPQTHILADKAELNNAITAICDINSSAMLVASWRDTLLARNNIFSNRLIRMEHGAGQNYHNFDNPAFIGGKGHKDLLAAFVPGAHQYQTLTETEPNLPVAVVGCPKLDFWSMRRPKQRSKDDKTIRVAVSFRYNMFDESAKDVYLRSSPPEHLSAFSSFRSDIENLVSNLRTSSSLPPDTQKGLSKAPEIVLLGHGHPYAMEALEPWWKSLGVTLCGDWEMVLEYADVLVVDNSSIAFEWLAANKVRGLNKPLILMNIPDYRRYAAPGMRFWDLEAQSCVFSVNPGELTSSFITAAVEASVTPPLNTFLQPEPGNASVIAREALNKILGGANADAENGGVKDSGCQVKFVKTVDYCGRFYKQGELAWVDATTALQLESCKFAVKVGANNPSLIEPECINLKDKQTWSTKNFSRYYQLLVPRWS